VIQTEGSYLTSENGEMTGQLFKNCWIKMGPKTKLVFSLSPTDKTLYLQVFTGSVHILFNKAWTDNQAEKLIINADEKQIETESGKFIFVRRPFFQDNSLYVKKGLVSLVNNMKPQAIFIHQNEKISFKDKADLNLEVEKMSERDIQELSGPKKTRKPE